MKKLLKVSCGVLGTLLGVILLLFVVIMLAVPPFARNYINDHGEELCGRKLYLEKLSLNPFVGSLSLDSLNLYEPDGQTPFVKLRNLDVEISVPSLFVGLIDVKKVHADRFYLNVEQQDSLFNFTDMIEFFSSEEDSTETKSEPLPVVIESIEITNSFVRYQDLKVGSDFKLADFSLSIPGIDLRTVDTEVGLSFQFVDGGSFDISADYDDKTSDFGLVFHLNRFDLHAILPYVQQVLNTPNMQGLLDAEMHVKGNLHHILAMEVQGESRLSDFLLEDESGEPCVTADSMYLATSEVSLLKNRYGFKEILIVNPQIRAEFDKDSLDNFSRMIVEAPIQQIEEDSATERPDSVERVGEEPFDLYIDRLHVLNGRLKYADHALRYDPFLYELHDLNFFCNNFNLSGINDISVNSHVGTGRGTVHLKYKGCFEDLHNMDVKLDVKHVELKDFSPYVLQMFGCPVEQGLLNFSSETLVKKGDLDSKNHLIINQPKVGKKNKEVEPEMKGVPLKAGLYILTDKNGVCDMELPVTGNIDEPKFSIKRLFFKTLGKLIVKVAVSPFMRGGNFVSDSTAFYLQDSLEVDLDLIDGLQIIPTPADSLQPTSADSLLNSSSNSINVQPDSLQNNEAVAE
ncbi:MAG: DUF748 domain-containing protein [Bacteroidales bacterium]|nr:DUF748 domain-containing protein [Bacteroidales bacterium]